MNVRKPVFGISLLDKFGQAVTSPSRYPDSAECRKRYSPAMASKSLQGFKTMRRYRCHWLKASGINRSEDFRI
jgi:hypothetical protein